MDTLASANNRVLWLHLLAVFGLLAVIYASIVPGMAAQWWEDPNYSHGFLVPLASAYFLWERRQELARAQAGGGLLGLPLLLGGLALLAFGYAGTEYFTMRLSLVVVLAGIVLFWFGREVFRVSAFPLGFLAFMVPLPYIVYDALAFPLKLLVAKYSVICLKLMGVVVAREGNIIMFPTIVLEVADACSGLRSLVSLIALGVVYAMISQKSLLPRLLLVALTVPIAIVTNMARVIATGFLAQYYGAAAAEGFFHEFAGMAVFGMAMVLLLLAGTLLRRWS